MTANHALQATPWHSLLMPRHSRSLCFAALLAILTPIALADSPMSAQSVLESVASVGARATLQRIYEDEHQWATLLNNIATGKRAWVDVAKKLRPGSDGGATEQLTLALGEALEHLSENVLTLAVPEYRIEDVCSGPDVDDPRFDSYELSMAAINRRQSQLHSLHSPSIAESRKTCISELEKAKAGVAHFYAHDK